MNLKVIFENNNCIILDKPSGWLSVPARFENDPRPVIGLHLQKQLNIQIFPVHRLDYETTGIIVFAKNAATHKTLSRVFESRAIQKTYQAITESLPTAVPIDSGNTLIDCMLKGKKRSFSSPHGQQAETLVTDKRIIKNFIDWTLKPTTGRSHQLRFQLSSRGYPILGDSLYGSKISLPEKTPLPEQSNPAESIALRAIGLEFPKQEITSLNIPASFHINRISLD